MPNDTPNRAFHRLEGPLVCYARVSTDEQTTHAQEIDLRTAGCEIIVHEYGSDASRSRPALTKLVRDIRAGDTLVVVRLDHLARSVSHLLEAIEDLTTKGAHFRSLRDPIDTSTPQGMFSLQVLGAVAQLERALISERTKAGISAAKAKGKKPGNPGIRERRPDVLAKMTAAQKAAYGDRIQATANQWLPTVRRMRPDHTLERYRQCPETARARLDPGTSSSRRQMDGCRRHGGCQLAQKISAPPSGRPADDAGRGYSLFQSGTHVARDRNPVGTTS